jgi:cell division FtsZ-interacting protein ZapD
LTPAASPVLRDIERCRRKLYDVMTKGMDRTRMRALQSSLRKMKENIGNTRRLGET